MATVTTEMLAPSQAARLLGLSARRVGQLADAGVLPSVSTPLGRLFAKQDIERLVAQRAAVRQVPA